MYNPEPKVVKDNMILVHGCVSCPFNYQFDMGNGYGCNLMKAKLGTHEYLQKFQPTHHIEQHKKMFIPITPDWCPLMEKDVVIGIDEESEEYI